MATSTCLEIISLNVNGLNAPNKRHRVAGWIKRKTHIYTACKRLTSDLKIHTDWKRRNGKIFHADGNEKKAGVEIFYQRDLKINITTLR